MLNKGNFMNEKEYDGLEAQYPDGFQINEKEFNRIKTAKLLKEMLKKVEEINSNFDKHPSFDGLEKPFVELSTKEPEIRNHLYNKLPRGNSFFNEKAQAHIKKYLNEHVKIDYENNLKSLKENAKMHFEDYAPYKSSYSSKGYGKFDDDQKQSANCQKNDDKSLIKDAIYNISKLSKILLKQAEGGYIIYVDPKKNKLTDVLERLTLKVKLTKEKIFHSSFKWVASKLDIKY